jgi:cardiolipin synthase
MTVPNFITAIRIILTPIFLVYLINDLIISALVVFILAGVSDGLDGLIARVFRQKTRIGAYLDPLADKLLLITAFMALAIKGEIPSWLTAAVISRDVLIMLGVMVLFLNGVSFAMKPSIISKMTTCAQLATVFMVLVNAEYFVFSQILVFAFFITGGVTIASGLDYMRHWFKMIGEEPSND